MFELIIMTGYLTPDNQIKRSQSSLQNKEVGAVF